MTTASPVVTCHPLLQVWIFDQPDGGGRLLRQRTGHSAPPTKVCYHGNTGQTLLTAGERLHAIGLVCEEEETILVDFCHMLLLNAPQFIF